VAGGNAALFPPYKPLVTSRCDRAWLCTRRIAKQSSSVWIAFFRYNAATLRPTNQRSGFFLTPKIIPISYSSASIGAALVSGRPSQEHSLVKY
jgi:hypothetical protein